MKYTALLRRLIPLAVLLLYLSPGLTHTPAQAAPRLFNYYDFESTLSPWTAGSDPGIALNFAQTTRNNVCPGNGLQSAELTISNTLTSPAGVWMVNTFTNTITSTATITWSAVSALACGGCTTMAYIGNTAPTANSQFKRFTPALGGTWQTYSYSANVTSTQVYVAIGFLDTALSFVYPKAIDLDCVYVYLH